MTDQTTFHRAATVTCISALMTWLFIAGIAAIIPDQPLPAFPEIVATATALSCVWLTRAENVLCWPIGIVSCLLMGWTFFDYNLPGQAWLQLGYFLPIQIYGWWCWVRRDSRGRLLTRVMPQHAANAIFAVVLYVLATPFVAVALIALYGPDGITRAIDASIVVASVIAQFLLSHKRVEAWVWWLVPVNFASILLYTYQGAYLYALVYVVFAIHAVIAIRSWGKQCQLV